MAVNWDVLGQAETLASIRLHRARHGFQREPLHGHRKAAPITGTSSRSATTCAATIRSAARAKVVDAAHHPLFLFNDRGDRLAAKLRPGNVHSADDWDELLVPEIERQQAQGTHVAFRADAGVTLSGFNAVSGARRKILRHPPPAGVTSCLFWVKMKIPVKTITIDARDRTHPFPHFWERMFGSG